ncbi:MAG TPA: hypothetical protein VK850_08650 [Candidatus Binatia bacterium]|nr:hypothetical protein [Candidatus Binatia bacterium]
MNLNDEQKKRVSGWIAEGLKLSDIQKRLETEFGLRLTYLETRLLIDELKLVPKDIEPPPPPKELVGQGTKEQKEAPAPGGVSVKVDTVTRPGALVSGKVTFSDGNSADWYLDQTGRLGLVPGQQGYRPSPADVQSFQEQLQQELQGLGF